MNDFRSYHVYSAETARILEELDRCATAGVLAAADGPTDAAPGPAMPRPAQRRAREPSWEY